MGYSEMTGKADLYAGDLTKQVFELQCGSYVSCGLQADSSVGANSAYPLITHCRQQSRQKP